MACWGALTSHYYFWDPAGSLAPSIWTPAHVPRTIVFSEASQCMSKLNVLMALMYAICMIFACLSLPLDCLAFCLLFYAHVLMVDWPCMCGFTDLEKSILSVRWELMSFCNYFRMSRRVRMRDRARKVGKRRVRYCRSRTSKKWGPRRSGHVYFILFLSCFLVWQAPSTWHLPAKKQNQRMRARFVQ